VQVGSGDGGVRSGHQNRRAEEGEVSRSRGRTGCSDGNAQRKARSAARGQLSSASFPSVQSGQLFALFQVADKLQALNDDFATMTKKKKELEDNIELCSQKLSRAEQLIGMFLLNLKLVFVT